MQDRKTLITLLAVVALAVAAMPALAADEIVNINAADESQLALLPRVGPALAARITEFREANGKFQQVEDLMLVRGIGEKTLELLEPFVSTSGETTLATKVSLSRAQEAVSEAREKKEKKDGGKDDGN